MPVRDATADDLAAIANFIRALAEYERLTDEVEFDDADLRYWLFGPEPAARVTIATDDGGAPVGMALWFITFSSFVGRPGIWLEDLFVNEDQRGRGYGKALIEDLRGRTEGRVEWSVLDWNKPSIDFYDSLGAEQVGGWISYRLPPT